MFQYHYISPYHEIIHKTIVFPYARKIVNLYHLKENMVFIHSEHHFSCLQYRGLMADKCQVNTHIHIEQFV